MSIDFAKEKKRKLTTQQMYEVIDFSAQAAEDNGFMNSFIFNRALYLFAAIILFPDRKEELSHIVAENINTAWDQLLDDGTLEKMVDDFPVDMEILAECGENWYNEYEEYVHSARGLLDTIQTLSGDIVKSAAQQLKNASDEAGIREVIDIADKWGMNNEVGKSLLSEPEVEIPEESLFEPSRGA